MVQESWPWPGTTLGDAGPYSDDDWDNMWETLYGSGVALYADRGVIRNWLNELEVTDASPNAVDVDTGAALVHGKFYRNTASVNVVVPSSSGPGNWREDLICLQSSWVAQTIRITRHANPGENVGYPAPTQTDGATWEIPLAAVRIDNVGTITLITDLRDYISDLMQPKHIFFNATYGGGSLGRQGVHTGWIMTGNQHAYVEFQFPLDLGAVNSAYLLMLAQVGGGGSADQNINADMDAGECNGYQKGHGTPPIGPIVHNFTNLYIECVDVTAAFLGGTFGPGMVGQLDIWMSAPYNLTNLALLGLDLRYR